MERNKTPLDSRKSEDDESKTTELAILRILTFFVEKVYGEHMVDQYVKNFQILISIDLVKRIVRYTNSKEAEEGILKFSEALNEEKPDEIIHSPESLISLCKLLVIGGETVISSECLWGAAVMELKDKCLHYENLYGLQIHASFGRFSSRLSRQLTNAERIKLNRNFYTVLLCHSQGFYERGFSVQEVQDAIEVTKQFLGMVRRIHLSQGEIALIKNINFNNRF